MRKILASAMATAMALCLISAVVAFGGIAEENLAFPYVIAILLILMWAAKALFASKTSWVRSPLHLPVLGFAVYAFVRYFASPVEYDSRIELFQVGLYTMVYGLAAFNFYRSRDRQIILTALMGLVVAESIYAIWQFSTRSDTVLYMDRGQEYTGRGSGTYICPNHLAGFLEMVLGLLLARVALRRARSRDIEGSTLQKVFIVYAALMAIVGIIVSLSRGGWVSTLAGFVLLMFWGEWQLRTVWPRLAVALVAISALLLLTFKVDTVRDRFAHSVNQENSKLDTSWSGRTDLWKSTLEMIGERPLLGSGPGTWKWFFPKHRDPQDQLEVDYAHQDVLHLISDYGFVGLALVLAIFVCFFWHAIRISRSENSSEQRSFAVGSGIAVASMLVHSWLDFNLHIPANALLLVTIMGMTMGIEVKGTEKTRVVMNLASRMVLGVLLLCIAFAAVWYGLPTLRANRFNTLGLAKKEVLYWDDALDYFGRATASDPKFPAPYKWTGDIYSKQALFRKDAARAEAASQAVDAFRQSLELNPLEADVWLRLGFAYEQAGKNDEALKALEKAIELDPNNSFVWLRVSMFYRHIGDIPRAKDAIKKAYDLKQDRETLINFEDLQSIPTEPLPPKP
jgi:O-antigen ligase